MAESLDDAGLQGIVVGAKSGFANIGAAGDTGEGQSLRQVFVCRGCLPVDGILRSRGERLIEFYAACEVSRF